MLLPLLLGQGAPAVAVGASVTTSSVLATGKAKIRWVAAIEGYKYLLTDGDTTEAVTAWAGTDWTQALAGLTVKTDLAQDLDPWNPFPSGGSVTLSVQPDSTQDTFGVSVFKTADDIDSELTVGIDADDTTITVRSSASFTTAPSELFIGTECIGYSALPSSTTVTASERGKYAPFPGLTYPGSRFARAHRVGVTENRSNVPPVASQEPRVWLGRRVGLWMHVQVENGLNTKADALCVFAGTITSVSDSPETGCTVVECKSIQDQIGDLTIGSDFWEATVQEGVYVNGSSVIAFKDDDGTTVRTANSLVIAEGIYTAEQIGSQISDWLQAEKVAARVWGNYDVQVGITTSAGQIRTSINWRIPVASTRTSWRLTAPSFVLAILGFDTDLDDTGSYTIEDNGIGLTSHSRVSGSAPIRQMIDAPEHGFLFRAYLDDEIGEVFDQRDFLPGVFAPRVASDPGKRWGLFVCRNILVVGAYEDGAIYHASCLPRYGFTNTGGANRANAFVRYDEDEVLKVRQIFILEAKFADLIVRMFASTGADGYNHRVYDSLPSSVGAGIPWSLLGDPFVLSCWDLDASRDYAVLVIDKPTRLMDLIGGDLILRGAALVWKDGGLRFAKWRGPGSVPSVATLTESNKATASGIRDMGRSSVEITDRFMRNAIKVEYDREAGSETYHSSVIIEDVGSIDDVNDSKTLTIKLRNSLADVPESSRVVQDATAGFLARLPLFSRPMKRIRRTVSPDLFESIAPGDVVTIQDNFARDPATGLRGLTKSAMVIGKRHDWGGPSPGSGSKARDMFGEVDLFLIDIERTGYYSPAAQLDDTANTGGFSSGYSSAGPSLTVYANKHTDYADGVDADYFAAGDKIRIVEIDPSNSASPDAWDRTVLSVSGNVITLTATLSSPSFDSAKKYRVYSQGYSAATETQAANVYQADDSDGRIVDVAPPFVLSSDAPVSLFSEQWADLPERLPDESYGDGKPLDSGSERALIRNVNHIVGNRTRNHAGMLFETSFTAPSATGTQWQCVAYKPIYLGPQTHSGYYPRKFRVAAHGKCSTAGQVARFRATISRHPPQSSSTATPTIDMVIIGPYSQMDASITSTSYEMTPDMDLDVSPLTATGEAWLILEVNEYGHTYGLTKAYERRIG